MSRWHAKLASVANSEPCSKYDDIVAAYREIMPVRYQRVYP